MVWNSGQQLFGRRYIIERKLGEGGIGITYLAKNRRGELRVIKTLSLFDQVISVAFTPDGSWLAAGDKSGNIKIWRRS
ncbi:hypothetical protein [Dendronalium sp. ChiSLP03b]|uniref:hypothetical protein n=1 Tax=Dendronalium sp. ChiSLP03b TaxID=3075381 RepID=UPI002AD27291|nr:hypothetical protein [Dendronalium sp. ChiSLP03b]MDZ8207441.1 hypothetical protein [Dendronalium sp. ChiSLP03b]